MTSPKYPWKPKLRIALNRIVFELALWRPNVCLKWPGFQISAYFCPALCDSHTTRLSKIIHWWPQKSAYYQKGFVFRFLWFGLIVRRIAVPKKKQKTWDQLIPDWVPDDAIDFETDRLISLAGLDEADTF